MSQRINGYATGNKAMEAFHAFGAHVNRSSLDIALLELVYFRVSQLNGCAFCLDMHAKDLRAKGETEQRLFVVNAWREAPFYSEKERAALLWAETLTQLNGREVANEIFTEVRQRFSETEMVDLTLAVIAINGYNRINLAFGANVGTYQVPQTH